MVILPIKVLVSKLLQYVAFYHHIGYVLLNTVHPIGYSPFCGVGHIDTSCYHPRLGNIDLRIFHSLMFNFADLV